MCCADVSRLGDLSGSESNDICWTLVRAIQLPCCALLRLALCISIMLRSTPAAVYRKATPGAMETVIGPIEQGGNSAS